MHLARQKPRLRSGASAGGLGSVLRVFCPFASDLVRQAFASIDEHRWRDLYVPHGFVVQSLTERDQPNVFAPEVLVDRRVIATLAVPVIYVPDSSSGRVRAALPAACDNLVRLREWISHEVRLLPAARVRLRDWSVSPDAAPAPYLPSGEPNGPPADWTVTATFDVAGSPATVFAAAA